MKLEILASADQLAVRAPAQDDGRVLLAQLTRRGRARFNAARRAHLANVHTLFLDPLTLEQRRSLGGAWAAIESALTDVPGQRESPPPLSRRARRRASMPCTTHPGAGGCALSDAPVRASVP